MKASFAKRLWKIAMLGVIFFRELWASSVSVARAAFARSLALSPAIIAVPLELRTDFAITTLANLVSLTPGTTSLHVSEDRSTLYVHCLDAPSVEEVVRDIKVTFERRLKEIEG